MRSGDKKDKDKKDKSEEVNDGAYVGRSPLSSPESDGAYVGRSPLSSPESDGAYVGRSPLSSPESDGAYVGRSPLSSPESSEELSEFEKEFGKPIKEIKSGITGSVNLHHYRGANSEIRKLLDKNGNVVVKTMNTPQADEHGRRFQNAKERRKYIHARKTYKNECDIIRNKLSKIDSDETNRELLRPKVLALEYDKESYILNECIYYDQLLSKTKTLEDEFFDMGNNISMTGHEYIQRFGNLFQGIKMAIDELHADGVLHLDSAPRNFMMTMDEVKVIDFGASLLMDIFTGKAINEKSFPLRPVELYNQAALVSDGRCHSIETDLFAVRVGMMQCMLMFLGQSQHEATYNILQGFYIREWKEPVLVIADPKKEINTEELRKISDLNNGKPVLIKHGEEIKIFGNPDVTANRPEDWRITTLGLCSEEPLNRIKFSSNEIYLAKFEDDLGRSLEEIMDPSLNNNPVLLKHATENNFWLCEKMENGWNIREISANLINSGLDGKFPDELLQASLLSESKALDELNDSIGVFPPDYLNPQIPLPGVINDDVCQFIQERKGHLEQDKAMTLARIDDHQRLNTTYHTVLKHASSEEDTFKQAVVMEALNQYKQYLTHVPDSSLGAENTRTHDMQLFSSCMAQNRNVVNAPLSVQNHQSSHACDNSTFRIASGLGNANTIKKKTELPESRQPERDVEKKHDEPVVTAKSGSPVNREQTEKSEENSNFGFRK